MSEFISWPYLINAGSVVRNVFVAYYVQILNSFLLWNEFQYHNRKLILTRNNIKLLRHKDIRPASLFMLLGDENWFSASDLSMCDFRLPPRSSWELRPSGLLLRE